MKRAITVCLFTLTLIIGTTAQSQDQHKKLEERAKQQSEELSEVLKLDDNQKTLVWRAIYSKEKNLYDNNSKSDVTPDQAKERKAKIDKNFQENMQKILSEDQYKKYTKWLSKQRL